MESHLSSTSCHRFRILSFAKEGLTVQSCTQSEFCSHPLLHNWPTKGCFQSNTWPLKQESSSWSFPSVTSSGGNQLPFKRGDGERMVLSHRHGFPGPTRGDVDRVPHPTAQPCRWGTDQHHPCSTPETRGGGRGPFVHHHPFWKGGGFHR